LSFLWQFGQGSGIPDSLLKDPGLEQFNTPGIFPVNLIVTDSLGLPDPTPATRTITVLPSGSTATAIPQTNWSLLHVDSEELVCGLHPADNAFDGRPDTFWHTQWCGGSPLPPHEIQIDLGLMYEIFGFRYLPRQDGSANGRIAQYEFYVSADGVNWVIRQQRDLCE